MKKLLLNLLSVVSRLINVLSGGSADLTFSARSHIDGLWTEKYIDKVAYHIFGEKDHCRIWWEYELERSWDNIFRLK